MTAQIGETLILDGKTVEMAFCPPIPTDHPSIRIGTVEDLDAYVNQHPEQSILGSTACWRGYIGTWEIREGRLYLIALEGILRLLSSEPIPADWVTAVLRIPFGKQLEYIHMGFATVYEYERHIRVEAGLVVSEKVIDNRGKPVDTWRLTWQNMPGSENRFDGDDL
jgi:hypothetical protein